LTVAVANGNLWSWGGNGGYGELGTGKADKVVTLPIQSKLSNVKQAYAGCYHTVALQGISIIVFFPQIFLEDGSVWSFGSNANGELGIGHKNATLEPQKLNLEPIQSISVGHLHSIALSS
jgi:alpha-tubulin suppressor-like RCC1 family protein